MIPIFQAGPSWRVPALSEKRLPISVPVKVLVLVLGGITFTAWRRTG